MVVRDVQPTFLKALSSFPVVSLTGPRQSGKSTLCRTLLPGKPYQNLESPDLRAFAVDDPRGFLAQFPEGAIIDEAQRAPDLLSYLQAIVDDDPTPGRWVLTGSQNFGMMEKVTQSLAGRAGVLRLLPMPRSEIVRFPSYPQSLDQSLFAGGYPRIFDRNLDPSEWLAAYVATYVERDVRAVAQIRDLSVFQRFLQLCAGRTAQLLSITALAADAGISQPTAKAWLSILEASSITFRLQPWHTNLTKRVTRTPKLHFIDTGLVCWLLGIRSADQLRLHPLRGAIFESFIASEILKHRVNRGESAGLFFYRDSSHLEADLLIDHGTSRTIIEVKAGQTVTDDLLKPLAKVREEIAPAGPVNALAVYGGDQTQPRTNLTVIPWSELHTHRARL